MILDQLCYMLGNPQWTGLSTTKTMISEALSFNWLSSIWNLLGNLGPQKHQVNPDSQIGKMPKAEVKEWPKPNCNTLNCMKNYNNNSEPKSIKNLRNLLNYLFKHLQWTPVIINAKQKCNFVLIFPHECPIWCFWKLTLKANGKHKYVYHSSNFPRWTMQQFWCLLKLKRQYL